MSKENALAFLNAAENDEQLILKIKVTHGNAKALLAIARGLGYDFTWQEWIQASIQKAQEDDSELNLSDEELRTVAGGIDIPDPPPQTQDATCPTVWQCHPD